MRDLDDQDERGMRDDVTTGPDPIDRWRESPEGVAACDAIDAAHNAADDAYDAACDAAYEVARAAYDAAIAASRAAYDAAYDAYAAARDAWMAEHKEEP